jgi:diguanylate cyclase (GGDEF)-like protein
VHAAGVDIDLTVSIGVATKDENTMDLHALIARADQAMYIAKHKGRNQVAISS